MAASFRNLAPARVESIDKIDAFEALDAMDRERRTRRFECANFHLRWMGRWKVVFDLVIRGGDGGGGAVGSHTGHRIERDGMGND